MNLGKLRDGVIELLVEMEREEPFGEDSMRRLGDAVYDDIERMLKDAGVKVSKADRRAAMKRITSREKADE